MAPLPALPLESTPLPAAASVGGLRFKRTAASVGALLLLLQLAVPAAAQTKFMGNATCASSNCHGSATPRTATNVLQNEYTTEYRHGAHVQAWNVLKNKESQIIAKHLGIGAPQNAELCLKCHATYVPNKANRGPRYRVEDGVGCESCHGAAEKYLKPHTARDSSHAKNVELGMIDLVSFETRATVCLECHHGTDDQTVNHRLIGAGHPRLTYELDTYGLLQPNHWEVDKDYVQRKAAYNAARAWLAGQVSRATEMVEAIQSKERSQQGAMPELSLFYCYNCHHSLKEDQWKKRSYGGRPGELHLNLSSLIMVGEGLEVLNPATAKSFQSKIAELHTGYGRGNAQNALSQLKSMLQGEVSSIFNSASFNKSVAERLLKQIVGYAAATPFPPYEVAEQLAMAMTAISSAIDPSGNAHKDAIDAVYKTLDDEENFNPGPFTEAAKRFRSKL